MFKPFKALRNAICLSLGAVSVAACGSGANGGSPFADPAVPSQFRHSQVPASTKRIPIPPKTCCSIAIDRGIDQIYVSSGVHLSGNYTTVVDGKTFSAVAHVRGFGGADNADSKTHNVWLAGLYSGKVQVYSGLKRSSIANVSLGYCPVGSWVDEKRRYAWVSAQCGGGSDPVWAIGADTYKIVAGPIHTGGVMGETTVNRVTGRFYVNNSSGNYEIDPSKSFSMTPTSFGIAYNVDDNTNLIYAQVTDGLNIVAGYSEKITRSLSLSYTPSFVGVNAPLNHIYIGSSGQNFIEVREGNTGTLLGTITLNGVNVYSVSGDYTAGAGHIYAVGASGKKYYLYKVNDTY
jgi:hypothetical protein